MYHLKLIKGLSYNGVVKATKRAPDVFVEDKAVADAAVATGYFRLCADGEGITPPPAAPMGTIAAIDAMNTAQLKAYAKKHNIDLGNAKTRDEIFAVIEAANADADTTAQFVGD